MILSLLIGCHVLAGAAAALAGAAAMLIRKGPGRHPRSGRGYLIALAVVAGTGAILALTDWAHLWHLPALGATAAALAALGYAARRIRWPRWLPAHIIGMAGSYIAMLTAFYVDNGPRLPVWNLLPPITFWLMPTAVGLPILGYAVHRHVLWARGRCSDSIESAGRHRACRSRWPSCHIPSSGTVMSTTGEVPPM